ncbi:type 2 periplasmic-binding domain-containing protein [Flindersiella endophytica]
MAPQHGPDRDAQGELPDGPGPRFTRRGFVTGTLGLGLAAAVPSALAACSSGGGSGDAESGASDAAAVKGGPKTTPIKGIPYADGYVGPIASKKGPIVVKGKQVTLKVAVPQDPLVGDWNKNWFSKWYEERTGVKVQYQAIAGDIGSPEQMTKVNAMLSSGDIPDVFMNFNFTPAQQMLYGQQGLFVALNDLIDGYAVETKRMFKDYPQMKDIITDNDGKIYSMPYLNDCFHCKAGPQRTWIYKPWLDKLGLKVPETTDEFEAVLEAFKTKDPNGNGKADELPLMGDSENSIDTYFVGSFQYNPGNPWLYLDNGKVDIAVNKPGWRECLQYLNGLYKKGLIAKEVFTQTNEQLKRIGDKKGDRILGVARSYYWGSFLTIDDDDPNAQWRGYVTVPTLKGPNGKPVAEWGYYTGFDNGKFIVTKACKNPAVAVMWADGQYELEAQLTAYSGEKGKGWRYAKQGEVGINGKQALWTTLGTWPPDNGLWWNQQGVNYRSNDFRLGEVVDPKAPTFEKALYEESKKYEALKEAKEQKLPPLYMTEDQAALTGELAITIENHVNTHFANFTIGKLDINDDAAWKKYTDAIDQMGLANYLKAYQDAYDAKYK